MINIFEIAIEMICLFYSSEYHMYILIFGIKLRANSLFTLTRVFRTENALGTVSRIYIKNIVNLGHFQPFLTKNSWLQVSIFSQTTQLSRVIKYSCSKNKAVFGTVSWIYMKKNQDFGSFSAIFHQKQLIACLDLQPNYSVILVML